MARRFRLLIALLGLLCFVNVALAATATSFCKCTCGTNSQIIQLDGGSSSDPIPPGTHLDAEKKRGTCLDCNKKFCEFNLSMCKDVGDENIFTTCFQRDSAKDEAIVFVFIFATVGLLSYAAVKPWVEKWANSYRERRSYAPVSTQAAEES